MPDATSIRKAMIIIAVSDYVGAYAQLPGTLTSAARLATWARDPAPGRDYKVLEITDAANKPVTVDRLRKEIEALLSTTIIDRLVVYFAGHGLVRSATDQFWLLTNAAHDRREGVDLMPFIDGLKRYSIGASNRHLNKGQLCIIADACRDTSREAINFTGDPILTSAAQASPMDMDMFLATTLGDFAYQPAAVAGARASCLFSDVLCEALEGSVPSVIDPDHNFGAVIDNQKLATYLDDEVPKRAKKYNEKMTPDTISGLRRDFNFYDVAPQPRLEVPTAAARYATVVANSTIEPLNPVAGDRIARDVSALGLAPAEMRSSGFGHVIARSADLMDKLDVGRRRDGAVVSEFDERVALPETVTRNLSVYGSRWSFLPENAHPAPQLFVRQRHFWTLAPVYPHSVTVLQPSNPGDVLVKTRGEDPGTEWDTALNSSVANSRWENRRMEDAIRAADQLRFGKERQPLHADQAGYIYHMIGDTDNVVRTAHYMAQVGFLSCDLACLAATELRWSQGPNGWEIYADLPAVEPDDDPLRPDFANTAMNPWRNVPVNTLFPVFRQGWRRMAELPYSSMPKVLRELSHMTEGYAAVVLPDSAMPIIQEHFSYVIRDLSR
ncbi:caspase family protein [Pseudophaeobacter sp. 1A16562]|uniref:caspase family protein n=1 Tax=Pseudophaeobacter sp. 1A16562 TaxID=3098143 RepID=UPI0034D76513